MKLNNDVKFDRFQDTITDELSDDEMLGGGLKLYDNFILPISNLIDKLLLHTIDDWKNNRSNIDSDIKNVLENIIPKKQKDFIELNAVIKRNRNYRVKGNSSLSTINAFFAYLYDNYIKRKTNNQLELDQQIKGVLEVITMGQGFIGSECNKIGTEMSTLNSFIMSPRFTGYHPVLFYLVFIYNYCVSITYNVAVGDSSPIFKHFYYLAGPDMTAWIAASGVREYIRNYYQKQHWNSTEANVNIIEEIYKKYCRLSAKIICKYKKKYINM